MCAEKPRLEPHCENCQFWRPGDIYETVGNCEQSQEALKQTQALFVCDNWADYSSQVPKDAGTPSIDRSIGTKVSAIKKAAVDGVIGAAAYDLLRTVYDESQKLVPR
jgi:hypothetical protein